VSGGGYQGSRALVQGGLPAGDVWFTAFADPSGEGVERAYLFYRRYFKNGGDLYSAVCVFPATSGYTGGNGLPPFENPTVKSACLPFLDSFGLSR
jgi:hypothetical protein